MRLPRTENIDRVRISNKRIVHLVSIAISLEFLTGTVKINPLIDIFVHLKPNLFGFLRKQVVLKTQIM